MFKVNSEKTLVSECGKQTKVRRSRISRTNIRQKQQKPSRQQKKQKYTKMINEKDDEYSG